jgi:hypothetical protein
MRSCIQITKRNLVASWFVSPHIGMVEQEGTSSLWKFRAPRNRAGSTCGEHPNLIRLRLPRSISMRASIT